MSDKGSLKAGAKVRVIGAGLAGSEAAWQLANRGIEVDLFEMRPVRETDAHVTENCAELVCSNSFRSDDSETNAVGVLHRELRNSSSLIMKCADEHQIPAGSALAVDRDGFSAAVTQHLNDHPLINIRREEVTEVSPDERPGDYCDRSPHLTCAFKLHSENDRQR